MGDLTKGLIGEQDLYKYDGKSSTFSRPTSTGGTVTLNTIGYEIDALIAHGNGTLYTQATIAAALTAIGTVNKVTLLLRPGTWVISSNADWSAYTNVTFKIVPGAVISGAFTVTLPTDPDAGNYQIFASNITIAGLKNINSAWFSDATKAAAALTAGGVLNLYGSNTLTATLTASVANTTIRGVGDSSILTGAATVTPLIELTAKVTLENFQLQGTATDGTTSQVGIEVGAGGGGTVITGLLISGASAGAGFNTGIQVDSGIDNIIIQSNRIERIKGTASGVGYGILMIVNDDCLIENNQITFTSTNGRHHIYLSQGCTHNVVSGNSLIGGTSSAISLYATDVQSSNNSNVISGNSIRNLTATTGGAIELTNWAIDNTVIGNIIYTTSANHGILLWDGSAGATKVPNRNLITGNKINYAGLGGITISGATNNVVIGNFFTDSDQAAASYAGIHIGDGLGAVHPSGNVIVGNHSSGISAAYALQINADTTTTYVSDNFFSIGDNVTIILNNGTGSIIKNNFGYKTENYGTTAAIATNTAVNHGLANTPTSIVVSPSVTGLSNIYISDLGATSFKINFTGGGNQAFYWKAEL